jgi:hypothetical protein
VHIYPNLHLIPPSDQALDSSTLPDKAMDLSAASAQLAGQIPVATKNTIIRYMAVINSSK